MKKRNPTDATLRNVTAAREANRRLRREMRDLRMEVRGIRTNLRHLARKVAGR